MAVYNQLRLGRQPSTMQTARSVSLPWNLWTVRA